MQIILDSSFARQGSAPIWGGKKGVFRDWTSQVAEHSFRARFANAIQHANKDYKNKHAVNRAIILFTQHPRYLCFCSL